MSATGSNPGKSQKLTPFHADRNCSHHWRSRWNSRFRRIGWSLRQKQRSRSIMRRMKALPGQTTFAAWWRWPMRDSNWVLAHQRWDAQKCRRSSRAESLSDGSHAIWRTESSSIPNTTKQEAGPTHFWGCNERPSCLQTAKDVAKLWAHWGEAGGPAVMKSSR